MDEHQTFDANNEDCALDAYGNQTGSTLRAGDRAPDAPGLTTSTLETSLSSIFSPDRHSVLLFTQDKDEVKAATLELATWPAGTIGMVMILPNGTNSRESNSLAADMIVEDKQGHAYAAYSGVIDEGYPIVVIRPDGVIGAVLKGIEGLKKYHEGIFY